MTGVLVRHMEMIMRERTTVDSFELHINYGQGWEHETTHWTRFHARKERKTYAQNAPEYPTKIVKRRVRKDSLEPLALKEITKEMQEAEQAIRAQRANRLAHLQR